MATVSIISCDGMTTCEEAVKSEVVLRILKDSTVLIAHRQDACDYHVGDVAMTIWQAKEHLIEKFIDEELKDEESQGWRFHSIQIVEQG